MIESKIKKFNLVIKILIKMMILFIMKHIQIHVHRILLIISQKHQQEWQLLVYQQKIKIVILSLKLLSQIQII